MIPSIAKKSPGEGNASRPVPYFLMMRTSNRLRNAIKNFGTREVLMPRANTAENDYCALGFSWIVMTTPTTMQKGSLQ